MTRRTGASIGDVAKLAGVSAQTVSRVARNEDTVRPDTQDRVRRAMRQLQYAPNRAARALRNGSFQTVSIVGHNLTRTGESHIIEAVTAALRAEGYAITLVDAPSSSATDITQALSSMSQAVDGMVVLRLETQFPDQVALPAGVPVVLSDSRFADRHTTVGTDHAGGSRSAVRHLLDLGHQTVHHVSGPITSVQAADRENAWIQTLRDAGRPVPAVLPGDWTPASGYRAGLALAGDPNVTAVFCANDEMAQGVLRAFHESGVRVPEDVSVVGFDDVCSDWYWPPLTTVAQDFEEVGRQLVAALMRQIRNPETPDIRRVLVPTRLVVRASSGPMR